MAGGKKDFTELSSTNKVYEDINESTQETADPEEERKELFSDNAEQFIKDLEKVAKQKRKKYKPRRQGTPEEIQAAQEACKTSGVKGAGMKRINLAFTPSNYAYISTMARVAGMTETAFVNKVISLHMEDNAAAYELAIKYKNYLSQ